MHKNFVRHITLFAYALLIITLAPKLFAVVPESRFSHEPFSPDKLLGKANFEGLVSVEGAGELWQAARFSGTSKLALAVGEPVAIKGVDGSDETIKIAAMQIAGDMAGQFGFAYEAQEVTQILRGRGTTTALILFFEDGREVYGAYSAITFNKEYKFASIKGRGYGSDLRGRFAIDEHQAVKAVAGIKEFASTTVISTREVWFPRMKDGALSLAAAYEVMLTSADPKVRPAVYLDATTGELISSDNRVVYDDLPGTTIGLYKPFRPSDRFTTGPFPEESVRLGGGARVYSDLDGVIVFNVNPGAAPFRITSELRGRWVDVNYEDGNDASFSSQLGEIQPFTIEWTRDNSREDERMLYYQTNLIHSYWKSVDPNFSRMDWVVPATCEYGDNYDNAFWNGQGMFFGNGAQLGNLALKGDVIQHEYTHGVTGNIYPGHILPYTGESGALNEGWSDYFPCSISDEPFMGENAPGGAGAMRNLDNDLIYPSDWFGEVHYDSRMVSAAMWHTREVLGADVTDPLFHFAKFELGNNFLQYFTDILLTDDDDGDIRNGTPNDLVLYEQFGRHGIGPGIFPEVRLSELSIRDNGGVDGTGDNDRIWEPGETIEVNFCIVRDGSLYPPPAENVHVTLNSDHPGIEIVGGDSDFGSLYVGDSITVNAPLQFRVADDAELSFADLYFSVSSDNFGLLEIDTLRIPVGTPHVLLVRDSGEGQDRTEWYANSLDELGVVYSLFSIDQPVISLDQYMGQFENVIWFTGDARSGFLAIQDRQMIAEYIDAGGNFVLTGQSICRRLNNNGFLEDYFGATVTTDSVNSFYINGVENDPVGDGLELLILGSYGANNQRRPGAIDPIGGGVECFTWRDIAGNPGAGVWMEHRDSGAKTLFMSFGIEGIGGHGRTSTRMEMLSSILDWLNVVHSVDNDEPLPNNFVIGNPYPNPFNGRVNIPVTLTQNGDYHYNIYDLTGRELWHGTVSGQAGRNALSLDMAGVGSGYYLVGIEIAGQSIMRRVLLLK